MHHWAYRAAINRPAGATVSNRRGSNNENNINISPCFLNGDGTVSVRVVHLPDSGLLVLVDCSVSGRLLRPPVSLRQRRRSGPAAPLLQGDKHYTVPLQMRTPHRTFPFNTQSRECLATLTRALDTLLVYMACVLFFLFLFFLAVSQLSSARVMMDNEATHFRNAWAETHLKKKNQTYLTVAVVYIIFQCWKILIQVLNESLTVVYRLLR